VSVIKQHEIPKGSRLYFGKTAKLKIEFEYETSLKLLSFGFEPIVTPNFIHKLDKQNNAIVISNPDNEHMSLRDDSTMETTRIITKRLGRTTKHKKWFYNQPVFRYPSSENYQIGAEAIDSENIDDMIKICLETLASIKQNLSLQLFDMNIIKKISANENINFDDFKNSDINKILKLEIKWLTKLLYVSTCDELRQLIDATPTYIQEYLKNLISLTDKIKCDNIIISPLYCSDVVYYEGVAFEVICDKYTIAKGGKYKVYDMLSCGFSLYTDDILKILRSSK